MPQTANLENFLKLQLFLTTTILFVEFFFSKLKIYGRSQLDEEIK
jgi:hypothetical protein